VPACAGWHLGNGGRAASTSDSCITRLSISRGTRWYERQEVVERGSRSRGSAPARKVLATASF
jgi:hypothetical protein